MPDCALCGQPYSRASNRQRFCSRQCRRRQNRIDNPDYVPTGDKPGPKRMFDGPMILRIRRRVLHEGVALQDIADVFGCSPLTIRSVARGYYAYKETTT